jgi:hypothetical protein
MVTLDAILASLARIEQEQSAVHETIINRHVGSTEQLKRLEAGQMNAMAAFDKLWQSLGVVERELDMIAARQEETLRHCNLLGTDMENLNAKLDAGLKGTADGVALAIAELRKELLGTPQRGRKHSYRGKKSKKRS